MVVKGIRKLVGKAMVAGALGLGALGSAQATLVVGVWDPQYDGLNFGNLGWRGKVEFNVPNPDCLNQPAGPYPLIGDCAGVTISSAVVELYNILAPGQPTLPFGSLDLLALGAWLPSDITAIELSAPGVVSGSEVNLSGSFPSVVATGFYTGPAAPVSFKLDISLTSPKIKMDWVAGLASGSNVGEPRIVYSVVPEPVSMALSGIALLALGWTRRRRS